ncbi:beclin-2 [Rhynchocyon petersi]
MDKDEMKTLQMELQGLELEEVRLVQELDDLEKTWKQVAGDLGEAQAETETLEKQEQELQRETTVVEWQNQNLSDVLMSLDNRLQHAQSQLGQLITTNIFHMTFTICTEGPLGTINNFRLGSLPILSVSWSEISAAWGQTALLLLSLCRKIGLEFQRYQLVPFGNHSHLKCLADDSELPLFYYVGQTVCLDNKFDLAMVAFLDCLQQFQEQLEKGGLRLPYRVNVEKGQMEELGGTGACYSIRTFNNTEGLWTEALKRMLVNLKCSLHWGSLR